MNIVLFSRPEISCKSNELRQIFDAIHTFGFDYTVNEEFAAGVRESIGFEIPIEKLYGQSLGEQPSDSLMVCIGGDGTLLEGVRRLHGVEMAVVGINLGHLGFLASTPKMGILQLFEDINNGALKIEERSMIEVNGEFLEEPDFNLALNEFSVQRVGAGMVSVEVFVDRQMVGTYHGDGVLVCTPTGSTAYSLSAGGPILAPGCSCLAISPLAPHNLTMRPIVVPDSCEIELRVFTRYSQAFVTLDNRTYQIDKTSSFTVKRASKKVLLCVPHNISFYDTLRDKMMWGVDVRG